MKTLGHRSAITLATLGLLGSALAACGGGTSNSKATTTSRPVATTIGTIPPLAQETSPPTESTLRTTTTSTTVAPTTTIAGAPKLGVNVCTKITLAKLSAAVGFTPKAGVKTKQGCSWTTADKSHSIVITVEPESSYTTLKGTAGAHTVKPGMKKAIKTVSVTKTVAGTLTIQVGADYGTVSIMVTITGTKVTSAKAIAAGSLLISA